MRDRSGGVAFAFLEDTPALNTRHAVAGPGIPEPGPAEHRLEGDATRRYQLCRLRLLANPLDIAVGLTGANTERR